MDTKVIAVIISGAALLTTLIVELTRIARMYGNMENRVSAVETNGKTAWKNIKEDVEKLESRVSVSESDIGNLEKDTASLTTMVMQLQSKVDKIDQKLDRIIERMA